MSRRRLKIVIDTKRISISLVYRELSRYLKRSVRATSLSVLYLSTHDTFGVRKRNSSFRSSRRLIYLLVNRAPNLGLLTIIGKVVRVSRWKELPRYLKASRYLLVCPDVPIKE